MLELPGLFADCSKIIINVIAKHVQHIGIIMAFYPDF